MGRIPPLPGFHNLLATRNSSDMSRPPTKSPLFDPGCPPATNNFHQYPKSQPWDYLDVSADLGIHRKVRGSTDHHRHQPRDQSQPFLFVPLCAPCARSVADQRTPRPCTAAQRAGTHDIASQSGGGYPHLGNVEPASASHVG